MAHYILSVEQMRAAEQYMFARGVESYALMRRAGEAVAACVRERYAGRGVLVLAGRGNNGGDGFVIAESLRASGAAVRVALLGGKDALTGDALRAAQDYQGNLFPLAKAALGGDPLIVDALFGTGLARAVEGEAAALLKRIDTAGLDVVAVDIPSGVHGDSGEVLGAAAHAALTVTFARKKYGHLLMPGRRYCGEVIVADIGVSDEAVQSARPRVCENDPSLWREKLRWPQPENHKYARGHALVLGGAPTHAGAARLAALGALRAGAGLVTIVCAKEDVGVYAAEALSLMTQTLDQWGALLADERVNTVVIGPGAGVTAKTRELALAALKARKRVVVDADALTAFATAPDELFQAIDSPVILTPHGGEFARLFPHCKGSKLEQALAAASLSRAVVVLKGYDSVIASPDGRAAINSNAPPTLATAGAGDVLGGICAGLLAQGMDAFDAGSAAVWMHGAAARQQGAGLIAEDLPGRLPSVLQLLKRSA